MPLYKRLEFVPLKPPIDLKPDEEVFYLRLTNEVFRNYDDYFSRVILCNSLAWSCSLTGKANLTFQEALDSEKQAKKSLKDFPKDLKRNLLYIMTMTQRFKILDACEEVLQYSRERYFKGEVVLAVIGNLWSHSKVINVIPPTQDEIETYKKEQIETGVYEKNDYLRDNTWGPPPDLFRYEVREIDPDDPTKCENLILDAIDVKREKVILTREKVRFIIKLSSYYDENLRYWRIRKDIVEGFHLGKLSFDQIFVGTAPTFVSTPGPPTKIKSPKVKPIKEKESPSTQNNKSKKSSTANSAKKESKKSSTNNQSLDKDKSDKPKKKKKNNETAAATTSNKKAGSTKVKGDKNATPQSGKKNKEKPAESKPKKSKPKPLTPEQIKQLEIEKKLKEREEKMEQKKVIAEFRKIWLKPKEDLEVEDLKDLPTPDPVDCKIPNQLVGEMLMTLEFMNCYSSTIKVRDCFPNGLTFDILENALTNNEIAGPLSDIIQMLLKTIFRLQEFENAEITQEQTANVELDVGRNISASEAIQKATVAATWSILYQNTPLNKFTIDHFNVTEVLRLHLLSSGSRPSEKDVKWRWQQRGCYLENDDPGLQLRINEPQIIKTLSFGSIFDLSIQDKIKVLTCLVHQILTYVNTRDIMDESFEQFKNNRVTLRSVQAAEKRKEAEDNLWKQKIRVEKAIPDLKNLKITNEEKINKTNEEKINKTNEEKTNKTNEEEVKPTAVPEKPQLTDEEIEAAIAKRDRDIAKRKQEYEYRIAELYNLIHKSEKKLSVHPLGADRAFRRYWIFDAIPGVFVEYNGENLGTCLPNATPYLPNLDLTDFDFVKNYCEKMKQNDKDGSDKENNTNKPKKVSKKKLISTSSVPSIVANRPQIFGICTGNIETCQVHATYFPRTKWSFFWNKEQIESLIDGLSTRGIREKELKQVLIDEKDGLLKHISKCPYSKLNPSIQMPVLIDQTVEKRTSGRNQSSTSNVPKNHLNPNLNYPRDTPIENIFQMQLRDLILEIEDKVFLGGLGSLKVDDRQQWRNAIEIGKYDKQTENIKWGGGKLKSLGGSEANSGTSTPEPAPGPSNSGTGTSASRRKDNLSKYKSIEKEFIILTNSDIERTKDEPIIINPIIKELACAILQLSQSVEFKFLKKPLGLEKEDDTTNKKKKTKIPSTDVDNVMKGKGLTDSALERWESSLMVSTSFPQLFMHLFTLDNSIEWNRSVLNARCRLCRRKGDPENMLLCDQCNKGHHLYCLKPPLQAIPKDDWYCTDCKPIIEPPKLTPRKRKTFVPDDEILDELFNSDEEEEDNSNDMNMTNSEEEVCPVCNLGGEVICCDGCPSVYHLTCLDPPKTRVPRGHWYCPECCSSSKKSKKKVLGSKKKKGKGKQKAKAKPKPKRRSSTSEEEESNESDGSDEEVDSDEDNEEANSGTYSMDETNDDTRENGYYDSNSEEEEEQQYKVKVKFNKKKNSSINDSKSKVKTKSMRIESEDEEEEEDDDEDFVGRGRKRKSASQAAIKISQATKRLRSDSKENESTSENSNDSNPNFHSRKRSLEADNGEDSRFQPKRTRLQRMNTNRSVENEDLDNILLDKIISDLIRNSNSWPFLKPVSKTEAPDYHILIKTPMDLGTIKYKLNSMVYSSNEEVFKDLVLVFSNCLQYNDQNSQIYKACLDLKKFCEDRFLRAGICLDELQNLTSTPSTIA